MSNMNPVDLLIFGGGGHAKVAWDCAQKSIKTIWMISADAESSFWNGIPIYPEKAKTLREWCMLCQHAFVAIGDNTLRAKITKSLQKQGFILVSLIHPSAIVSPSAHIADGVMIGAGAIVNADATIEEGCIINSGAIVEHDCVVSAFSHIAPGSVLGGGTTVNKYCRICIGATVIDHVHVGSGATVAAGATVIHSISPNVMVAGVPATVRKHLNIPSDEKEESHHENHCGSGYQS